VCQGNLIAVYRGPVKIESLLSADPDVHSLDVTDVTQASVTLSWSVGETQVINATVVYYRATDSDQWINIAAITGTSHSVTSLEPGTEYQFFVQITSYGKSSSSENTTKTTGKVVANFVIFSKSLSLPSSSSSKQYYFTSPNFESNRVMYAKAVILSRKPAGNEKR